MRNLKKILAMALTVLMVVGSFAMTATAAFDDVTDYQEAIEVMAALGIAAGKSETEFAPDDDVTREEMALWIAKIMTGKVAADYVTNNFLGAVENLTAFADLDEDNYVGAINYATNNGIIVGTSATTFEPAEAIKIQDVFAMVVRMLGYGSTAMNNNYPWSFIDKAISLGLDADLPADYSNEAVASRGETMQILYNALTALKSDGSTLGYDFFGLEKATVVITGTAAGNMYTGAELVTKTVDDEDFVSFSILNANGTVASDKATYYVLKSAFGIEDDAQLYVGDSFVVRTVDGFASFLTCEANEKVIVNQDVVVGASSNAAPANKYVTVDGTKYKLVKSFSDFVATNDGEIIFTVPNGLRTEVYDAASYVMDSELNIIGEDGEVLLYWVTTIGVGNAPEYANLNGMYLYKLADGNYIQPNDYIWSLAKKVSINTADAYGFNALENSYTQIEKKDAYSDTVLYDDDADGDYDRAVYYQYNFGKITDDGNKTIAGTKYYYHRVLSSNNKTYTNLDYRAASNVADDLKEIAPANIKTVDAEGNAIDFATVDGKYVLYHYNPLYKTIIIKEVFEGNTGLVTGVDLVKKTITLNAFGANIITGVVAGETYTIGNDKLTGAEFDTIKALDTTNNALTNILGKNINFIEKDGKVLAIYNAVDDAKYMVYVNDAPGYTTMGYTNILAYYDPAANRAAATQAVVTVNAVNNYWYSGYVNAGVTGVSSKLEAGDLLAATKDALGNYDVKKVALDLDIDNIYVNQGIVSATGDDAFAFAAAADTVFIIWKGGYDFQTFTGIPANGASITGIESAFRSSDDLVYLVGEDIVTSGTINNYDPWNSFAQTSTIIYADTHTVSTMQATNAYTYGIGYNVGMTYTYNKAIDVINGGFVSNIMSDYNFNAQLVAGNFYEVKNGYVVKLITPAEYADYGINKGLLLNADKKAVSAWSAIAKYSYDIATAYTKGSDGVYTYTATKSNTNAVLPILYKFNATNDVWKDSLIDLLATAATGVSATADAQTAYNYVLALNDTVDVANDDLDTAVEVYYYAKPAAGKIAIADKLESTPVFIASATTVQAKAYVEPTIVPPTLYDVKVSLYAEDAGSWVAAAGANTDVKLYKGISFNGNTVLGDQITLVNDVIDCAWINDVNFEDDVDDIIVVAIAETYEQANTVSLTYTIQNSVNGLMNVSVKELSVLGNTTDVAMNYNYYVIELSESMEIYDMDNTIAINIGVKAPVAAPAAE